MQRSMAFTEMAQKSLAHIPELLVYRDDICVLSVTWENQFVGEYFCRVANSRFDLKMSFGPKSVTHLGNLFLGKRHNRVHPGHFPSREGENERRPISCAHSSWIKRSTLLCRKMTWVHPVVSFPLYFLLKELRLVLSIFRPSLKTFRVPQRATECSVLAVLNFVKPFVPSFVSATGPLVALTRKGHETASWFRKAGRPPRDAALSRVK